MPVEDKQTPEQVAGEPSGDPDSPPPDPAALANAMNVLGHSWHQTTVVKTEAAGRPLRLNEVTDLADVLGVEVSYLLGPPLTGRLAASKDLREVMRLQEIIEHWTAEHRELEQQYLRKTEDLRRARREHTRHARGCMGLVLC